MASSSRGPTSPVAATTPLSLARKLAVLGLVASACAGGPQAVTSTGPTASTGASTTSTTVLPVVSTTAAVAPTTFSTLPETTTTVDARPITDVTAERLGHSWSEGCPVAVEDLRLVRVDYLGFDGAQHRGELVVHRDQTLPIVEVFATLLAIGFPVESVIPIGDLPEDAEDDPAYNNTSAFDCRFVEGTTSWSQHAFGRAIDINPFQNPFVDGDRIWPTGAGEYLDRDRDEAAMIQPGDGVVEAFASIGWPWGGNWNSLKDYQHFSSTGT